MANETNEDMFGIHDRTVDEWAPASSPITSRPVPDSPTLGTASDIPQPQLEQARSQSQYPTEPTKMETKWQAQVHASELTRARQLGETRRQQEEQRKQDLAGRVQQSRLKQQDDLNKPPVAEGSGESMPIASVAPSPINSDNPPDHIGPAPSPDRVDARDLNDTPVDTAVPNTNPPVQQEESPLQTTFQVQEAQDLSPIQTHQTVVVEDQPLSPGQTQDHNAILTHEEERPRIQANDADVSPPPSPVRDEEQVQVQTQTVIPVAPHQEEPRQTPVNDASRPPSTIEERAPDNNVDRPRSPSPVRTQVQDHPPPPPPGPEAIRLLNAAFRDKGTNSAHAFYSLIRETPRLQPQEARQALHHLEGLLANNAQPPWNPDQQRLLISTLQDRSREGPAIDLLNDAFRNPGTNGAHAFYTLIRETPRLQPQEAMEALQHVRHLLANNAQPPWNRDQQKVLVSTLQSKSRQDPVQHVQGYLEELGRIPAKEQPASAEFSELKKTINGLSKAQARQVLLGPPRLKKVNYPQLHTDPFRELKEGIKNRAQVRVWGARGEPQEFKDMGDFGFKAKTHRDSPPGDLSPANADAFNTNFQAQAPGFAEDGRAFYERSTYLNLSKLQVDRGIGRLELEGKTKLGEGGIRSYIGTGSSIDPKNIGPGYQSFMVGTQVGHNYLHSNYAAKYARGNDKAKLSEEASFDGYVGHRGDVRCAIAIGQYPMVQIQGAAFTGGRAAVEVKTKLKLWDHDAAEGKGKAFVSGGAEAAGTMNLGRVYDVIEGKTITTGVEFGGMAFAGVRVGGEVGGSIAGIGAKLKGELWHGVGLVNKMHLQKDQDGTLSWGGEFGAALGVGGSVAWGVTINPGKFAKALPDRVTTRAKELAQPVGEFALNAVRPVGEAARSAGRAVRLPRLAEAGKGVVNAAGERPKANLAPRDRQFNPALVNRIRASLLAIGRTNERRAHRVIEVGG